MAPAIEIAERGYTVPVVVQQKWGWPRSVAELVSAARLRRRPSCRTGRAPAVGELFRFAGAARTLRADRRDAAARRSTRGEIAAGDRSACAARTAAR